ncbi:MAG: hypothetical protein K2G55_17920 [Lachnospiraceae bacterium]|nr:hypothetical protein [Lachnospiraceae bacterium]MDE7203135.1 hypothetical protein [Lachnospiraceae bacterium]
MKRKNIGKWIYAILFFVVCMIHSVGMLFYHSELAENRTLSEKPVFWAEEGWNRDYFQELQTYVSEHFAFRSELVAADSMIKYKLFHTPSDDQVVIGKEDWLFFGETLSDYAGVTMTDSELDQIASKMTEVCDYIESQGKKPLFVIVPNKNQIYPEYMPMRFGNKAEQSNLTLLQEKLLQAGIPYVDAYHILLEGKIEDEMYLHEDTHWNNTGARLVLNEIYKVYGLTDRYELTVYQIEESHSPDLYAILFPAVEHFEAQRIYKDGKSYQYIGRMHSVDDLKIRTAAEDGNGKSILVYRDSFGRALIPYMGGTFDNVTFNRSTPYDLSLVKDTECDYVLIEIVERNLADLGQIQIP